MGQAAEQSHIHQIDLKCRQIIICSYGQSGSGAAVDFMHQPGIHQPLQSILIFPGARPFFDHLVDKFLICPCQLGWYGFPDHRDLREFTDVGVLGKVTFISADDSGQSFLHSRDVSCFCPHEHWFGHTACDIVHLQFLIKRIEKGIRNWLNGIHILQVSGEIFVAVGRQKFHKSHRINLHKVHFAYREGRRLRQSNSQQRTGAGNVILRSILEEILYGVDNFRAVLYFVKDNERLFWHDLLAAGQH